ncbi:MAG: protein-(glutamine-N5) methyltransferase, release factor-specific [Gammaproteobacteria bacterium CG11_big_fil_rev_8_21_14_0_20_46_22]|nr:MAG: protein-(glutamine-N5) methyltransferase, release factor-specific [Gammaproteobacteria bacterium CG12_big_fil_rev_8_21_14_0_65_46_12]PIR11276.1 MAG: protein-(glutamine-N5) methyltransferase, release factor-specific [Gammaproteobacteria bacterium CG11_big_fil_rev_8_21_14_0_20_46_22]
MPTLSIQGVIRFAVSKLQSESARLDTEILLSHVLKKPRSYLYAWPEKILSDEERAQFDQLLSRRLQGEPMAYITGVKEFYGREFRVQPGVLVPRPETELLIDLVLETCGHWEKACLYDLGTGSGAIGITLACEKPSWSVTCTDQSELALSVARHNADLLGVQLNVEQRDWCESLPADSVDIIVSNPPYIAEDDAALEKAVAEHEPKVALIADNDGFSDFDRIIEGAKSCLKPGGYIFLEHGYDQAKNLQQRLLAAGFSGLELHKDLAGHDRAVLARL